MSKSTPAAQSRERLLALRQEIDIEWSRLAEDTAALRVASLARQPVHGDVSPVNMVFQEDGLRFALIDWDCAHSGIRLYDALGDVLNRRPAELAASCPSDPGEVRDYLRGYAAATNAPLTDRELACVPLFCRARQLEDLRQRLAVLPRLPADRDTEYAALIDMRVNSIRLIREEMVDGCPM